MERLSTDHLRECMEPTMEKTSYRLNYIYPLLQKTDKELHDLMESATVGTMFALPWFLTWFGHSLNQYRDVVRLYDYFLASPSLMPLYVATSLVIERREDVFDAGYDMALIHCTLSQIPDNLNFEVILKRAWDMYQKYPPEKIEKQVKARVQREYVYSNLWYFLHKIAGFVKFFFGFRFIFCFFKLHRHATYSTKKKYY